VHELSICQALLQQVAAIAVAHRAQRVTAIRLGVGALAGVEPALLERAFTLARAGTLAAAADLIITTTAVAVSCRSCGRTAEVAVNRLSCPACGAIDVRVTRGEELILESLELDVEDDIAADPKAVAGCAGAPAAGTGAGEREAVRDV
jgi:hydrogenase nickel incorporation protein HypA/HybF